MYLSIIPRKHVLYTKYTHLNTHCTCAHIHTHTHTHTYNMYLNMYDLSKVPYIIAKQKDLFCIYL